MPLEKVKNVSRVQIDDKMGHFHVVGQDLTSLMIDCMKELSKERKAFHLNYDSGFSHVFDSNVDNVVVEQSGSDVAA